jgi:hypothetical protein
MSEMTRMRYPADLERACQQPSPGMIEESARELLDSIDRYVHRKPVSATLWALGIGFFLGWKLKPW